MGLNATLLILIHLFGFALLNIFYTPLTSSAIETGKPSENIKYLALGDSYTIGEGVVENLRWPVILQKRLQKEGYLINSPTIIAKTGWTTFELREAIENQNVKDTFGLVSLLIGVNNQYRGLPIDNFKKDFKELLNIAVKFAGNNPGKVFVLSIPDYGVTPFAVNKSPQKISDEIEAFNKAKREIAEKAGVKFYNITPISMQAKNNKELLAEDELHPSGEMYQQWVDLIIEGVKESLDKKG